MGTKEDGASQGNLLRKARQTVCWRRGARELTGFCRKGGTRDFMTGARRGGY